MFMQTVRRIVPHVHDVDRFGIQFEGADAKPTRVLRTLTLITRAHDHQTIITRVSHHSRRSLGANIAPSCSHHACGVPLSGR